VEIPDTEPRADTRPVEIDGEDPEVAAVRELLAAVAMLVGKSIT
jgi:hypothetical protein